jgi:predicted solute-binding protein
MRITIAHSPDSDGAFMFYGLARGGVPTGDLPRLPVRGRQVRAHALRRLDRRRLRPAARGHEGQLTYGGQGLVRVRDLGRRAVQTFLDRGFEAGIVPRRVALDVVAA